MLLARVMNQIKLYMYKRETHKLVKKSLIMCMYSQHDSLLESNYQTQSIRIWLANLIFLLAKQFFHSQWLLKYQPLSGLKYGNETWNCYMYSTLIIVVSGHVNLELYASVFTKPLLYRFSSSEQSDSKIRMYGLYVWSEWYRLHIHKYTCTPLSHDSK